ncbi:MAG: radical SAM protein [Clostridia bacterium]|nr:radical SAM protein [Clostridia bacterium]
MNVNKKKNITLAVLLGVVFFLVTYVANTYLAAFELTSVRPSAAFNPVFSIAFGWPAILACAISNFLCDLASGYGMTVAALGFVPQVLYGMIPYYVWKSLNRSLASRNRLDSPLKTIEFAVLMGLNAAIMGVFVSAIQNYAFSTAFISTAVFTCLNNFDMCMIFGLPIMALVDYHYSKVLHNGRRKLSVNEVIILLASAVELIAFGLIIMIKLMGNPGLSVETVWQGIFSSAATVLNVILIVSLVCMYAFHMYKVKHAGLRIIEKKNGTIYVDEAKRLEFISFPSREVGERIKLSTKGEKYEELVKRRTSPKYEDSWCVMLSNQKGCPMKCTFCDCPSYGYYGNVSREELRYQMDTILETSGSTYTKWFEVNFMRMGEPSFNKDILDYIEFDMRDQIRSSVHADVIYPTISTMMPKTGNKITEYLKEYARIKNEVYDGNASLQISVNTTDEEERNKAFQNMSMGLEDIAKATKDLPMPKGMKYLLNFAVGQNTVVDADVIDSLFDKSKFAVKITTLHETFNAKDNGFVRTDVYKEFDHFEEIEKSFTDRGWDVVTYMDTQDEDSDQLTCGNLALSNLKEKVDFISREKKRIGLIVAIEMEAIFSHYDNFKELESPDGFKLILVERDDYQIFILQAGMGEVAASAGVQYLIAKCGVSKIFNFGVVGGMTSDMKKLKVCLVDRVVHYKYDCSEFMDLKVGQIDGHDSIFLLPSPNLIKNAITVDNSLQLVTCCSGDKFIATAEEKTYLHETFEGDICDMESAGIVLTCEMNNVPCILFKAVSDGLADGAEGFYQELLNASKKCLELTDQVLDKIALME